MRPPIAQKGAAQSLTSVCGRSSHHVGDGGSLDAAMARGSAYHSLEFSKVARPQSRADSFAPSQTAHPTA